MTPMIPKSHPRYASLLVRDRIVAGVRKGVTSPDGLIAHGRGEAFDYLIGEKTQPFAKSSIEAAAACLLLTRHPVISVNGNAAALCPKELVALSAVLGCPLEVNIFHASGKREKAIAACLMNHGAKTVLLPGKDAVLEYLQSNRKYVNREGIFSADTVFVPLEDGDRARALIRNGKKVVTIDLNPLSRTAKAATVTIVDNITRALPLLITRIKMLKKKKGIGKMGNRQLCRTIERYDNKNMLAQAERKMRRR